MYLLRKIGVAVLVLLISAGIFFLLVKEQDVKQDILRTALELFGNDLLAMIPDGPQKQAVQAKLYAFIDQAQKNQIPEEQIRQTIAVGLNLRLNARHLSPEELEELFALPPEAGVPLPPPRAVDRDRLARDITRLLEVSRDWEKFASDSLHDSLLRHTRPFFAADSGFKVILPAEVMEMRARGVPPTHWQERIRRLQREKMVILYNSRRLPPFPRPDPYSHDGFSEFQRTLERLKKDDSAAVAFFSNPDSVKALVQKLRLENRSAFNP
ncbi:MAG: hypothetical protein ONB12_06180 [candidate division KSB1 bacterium]|nr:hypothetical protein [candidate division KSB1 bacterium]